MYRFFLQKNSIIVTESTEREFRQSYPGSYELISSIAEYDNIEKVLSRLQRDYRAQEVIKDFQQLTRTGWKYLTDEQKAKSRESSRKAKVGKARPKESNAKTSATMKGKSNFKGKRHSKLTKMMIATTRYGKNPIGSLKWCHHPYTGKELRCLEHAIPEGFVLGRSPEFKDYIAGKGAFI